MALGRPSFSLYVGKWNSGYQASNKTSSHSEKGEDEKIVTASICSVADVKFEKRTMRYVDLRIVPILALVASFAVIDRVNIGSAYAAGMGIDLALNQGSRLSLVICLFFIPDVLLQLPGNLLLRKFRVRNWLTFTVLSWGAVQLGMGFVRDWRDLVVCRVLLGACESTLYPSMVFILTTWYKRHEVQKRLAVFMIFQQLASGLSPILAYALTLLGGKGKLAGWRWIFVVEGIITLLLAAMMWSLIPDFPDKNNFLTAEQTALVLKRIDDDRGDAIPDPVTVEKIIQHLSDWTIWTCGFMFMCCLMPAYAQSYFLPVIISQMGWPGTQALLLSAAPCATAPVALLIAYFADRYKHRSAFIALTALICITGLSLLAFAGPTSVRYFGSFLIGASSGCLPAILAFSSNNVVSQSKRSVQTAVLTMSGEIGGLLGTVLFRAQDAPRYIPGLTSSLISQGLLLLVLFVTTMHFFRQNRLMKAGKRTKPLEGQPGFYYTL